MSNFDNLIEECRNLPREISGAAEAIAYFCAAVSNADWTRGSNGRWRPSGENFVTLKPQWKQANSLAITLRGNPDEFEKSEVLELKKDQHGYSAFRLESADQIADAFGFIRRAHILFERGRTRQRKTPVTIG